MIIWALMQLPRFIAMPLIGDVLAGIDSPAWLYPAILDVVVAVAAPFVAYFFYKETSPRTWLFGVLFLVVSILDHGGSVSADILTATPQVFGGEEGPDPMIVSSAQGVVDAVMLFVLLHIRTRKIYLGNL